MTTIHTEAMTLDEMFDDAIVFALLNNPVYGCGPGITRQLLADTSRAAEIRSFTQMFGSTTGPYPGYGGSAMTAMRITAVKVGHEVVYYIDGLRAYTVHLGYPAAMSGWTNSVMPHHASITEAIPEWSK